MLSDALGRWEGITVVSDEKLYPALKRAGIDPGTVVDPPTVRRVAEETGGWTAVTGEVLATGGRVRISARAWDVPTNRQLVRASSEIPSGGDMREAFDSLSLRLLQLAGRDAVTADLASSTTRDLDAYRAYLRGLAHQRRTEIRSATTAYEEAVRRDSSFALAWMRLSEMVISAEPASILNPMSRAAQYSARAVALSGKLPPRQRGLVLANNAQFRAQFSESRRILEGLLKEDSTDVEALTLLAALETFDPILVGVPGGKRPRGSPNAAARHAKRAVQLDPSRHAMFALLASLFAQAGVPGSSPLIGVDREPTGFPDLMQMLQQRERVRVYWTVLRDSLVLVPAESLALIPKDGLRGMRKAARGVARTWAEQWLSVAPDQAAPHQLMSALLMYDADYAGALRELEAAESIGVETPTWSTPARRLVVLAKSGDITGAGRLADSLTAAGFFANPNNVVASGDASVWAFALHILRARVAAANTVYQQAVASRLVVSRGGSPEHGAFVSLMGNEDPDEQPGISRAFRDAQLDSVLTHLAAFADSPGLGQWLPMMLPMLAQVADTTRRRVASLLPAADALATKGKAALAFQLANNAVAADSTLEPRAAAFPWYRSAAEALNAVKLSTQSRFTPATARVSAQEAVFEWRVDDAAPFTRNRAETPPGRGEYRWDVTVELDQRYYRLSAGGSSKVPTSPPVSGPLGDILSPTANRSVSTGATGAGGVLTDTTRLQGVALRTEIVPGALRMIVTDTGVVNTLRRSRPGLAQFRFEPCVVPAGTVGQKQCVAARIPITYEP